MLVIVTVLVRMSMNMSDRGRRGAEQKRGREQKGREKAPESTHEEVPPSRI
ncbi:hypothetical protein [Actinoplanes aureus]|uniref:hypothetical protein n=1 Tax=Actinoplanes aureus TaxID=2792083 RepID=UPI001E3EC401|nr:hypothetical protein [Actinoplanes aureus]